VFTYWPVLAMERCIVWYKFFESMPEAIKNEKQLKEWRRQWKLNLIDEFNSEWKDLYDDLA